MKLIPVAAMAAVMLLSSGCVMKSTHEATLQELNQTRVQLGSAQQTIKDQRDEIERNQAQIAKDREEIAKGKSQIEFNNVELSEMEMRKLQLQQDLEAARKELGASQEQLETMKQIEAETQKRNEIYAQFVKELQKMIDGGQLTVSIEKGRIVINLPDEVLFASGSATVNKAGQEALAQIAKALAAFPDRRFQVEGHTDNVPIKSARFPSNWELSTARALSVVHLMIDEGVSADNVSAAGFGEFHPRATNETPEGRALNRRIEIIMLPNLEILSNELPKLAE
ncbi:OmpA family protein [Sulfurimonas sp. HSL-3221]|uniref:OmpA/MotB family protein n=1 Tax=Thiomicrolovo TaxID=3451667 RepID=UPI001E31D19C|nr:OmpA family protein [Sulfurimonas sp. HSL-3221]UFS63634.1 OmpA family protein [Sulfurimonas sp. HSL-3221]